MEKEGSRYRGMCFCKETEHFQCHTERLGYCPTNTGGLWEGCEQRWAESALGVERPSRMCECRGMGWRGESEAWKEAGARDQVGEA